MKDNCRDMCVLVRQIVDTMRVQGRGCQAAVQIGGQDCACGCTQFISATAGPCVTLRNATIEPLRNRSGSCIRAELLVPVTLLLCENGRNFVREGEICLPIEGIMRNFRGGLPELVAQANVFVRGGCCEGDTCRLWVDYTAEVYAVCQRAVRMPVLGPCDTCNDACCQPFFDLPLYPRGMDQGHGYC